MGLFLDSFDNDAKVKKFVDQPLNKGQVVVHRVHSPKVNGFVTSEKRTISLHT